MTADKYDTYKLNIFIYSFIALLQLSCEYIYINILFGVYQASLTNYSI